MLTRYKNFPENVHCIALVQYKNTPNRLQQVILRTFHCLNQEDFDLSALNPYLKKNFRISFEVGVADGVDFRFLDQKELGQCLKLLKEKEVKILDFFFVVRYHLVRDNGKRVPLRFDYHIIRLLFQEGNLEMRIRHERGTQRVSLDDLTKFLVRQINLELSRRQMLPLFFNYDTLK
ncbi:MAG: hypothetical protein NWE80_02555 [Candidatus Bathyarchaeota archaeon]|nr:hypothetical protein [Candidatus Bathyarchaeota archaeon]